MSVLISMQVGPVDWENSELRSSGQIHRLQPATSPDGSYGRRTIRGLCS